MAKNKKAKSSIFTWLLLAALLPVGFIFLLVLVATNKIIYDASAEFAEEKTTFFARQASGQISTALTNISGMVRLTSHSLATIAADTPEARQGAFDLVKGLMESNSDIHNSWFAFEPGSFSRDYRFVHSFLNRDGTVEEIPAVANHLMDDPNATPWYNVALSTGRPFFDLVDHYDYEVGDGKQFVGTIAYPVIRDGKTIGAVGMDILYDKTLRFLDSWQEESQQRMLLLTAEGVFMYSSDPELVGKSVEDLGFSSGTAMLIYQALLDKNHLRYETRSRTDGRNALINILPVLIPDPNTRMYLYMEWPVAAIHSQAYASVQVIFFTIVIGLVLLSASVYFATLSIMRPVKNLTTKADWIANGQLDVVFDDLRVEEPRHEVDLLQISMRKMLTQLNQNHKLKLRAMESEFEKQKLVEASAAKTRFFANMSHEIRTPMNAILGMSELLLNEPMNERQHKYVHDIKNSSESLLVIINDILDLSRLESGKLSLNPVHYDFGVLIEGIYSLCLYLARDKHLAFTIEPVGELPACLFGDDVRVRQILINVLSNAFKYTDNGSVCLRIQDEGKDIRFEVHDTGIGISRQELRILFEPFRQVESRKTRHISGSGLGLSICNNLLELMHGRIEVESEPGKGSVFRVWIPHEPGDPALAEKVETVQVTSYSADARVLLVDDSEVNLHVAAGLLGMFNIQCDLARSGGEAIDLLAVTPYDMVFMDHMMPGMDGVEATKQIRALGGRFAYVPIVALTANAVIGSRELFFAAGMNDFLAKPIEKIKMQGILSRWMPKEKRVSQTVILPAGEKGEAPYPASSEPSAAVAAPDAPDVSATPEAAANESMNASFLDRARKVEGLDVNLGLGRVVDDADLYEKLLWMVCEMTEEQITTIRKAWDSGDMNRLKVEVHGSKGALANIGAMPLSEAAAALERAAADQDRDTCERDLPAFLERYRAFTASLQQALNEKPGATPAVGADGPSAEELAQGVSELYRALLRFDYEASQNIAVRLTARDFGVAINARLQGVRKQVDQFDYEKAAAILERDFPDQTVKSGE